jgi:hypothetical protein
MLIPLPVFQANTRNISQNESRLPFLRITEKGTNVNAGQSLKAQLQQAKNATLIVFLVDGVAHCNQCDLPLKRNESA